ncbi:MAG: hypothetical protein ABSD20_18285 [Terriglobales bacterium]|jgi:hypothetical protein
MAIKGGLFPLKAAIGQGPWPNGIMKGSKMSKAATQFRVFILTKSKVEANIWRS